MTPLLKFTPLLLLVATGCTSPVKHLTLLDDCPVVAKIVKSGADELLVADYALVGRDTIDFPLSALVENIQIVKLDLSDKALINGVYARISLSEHYILIDERSYPPRPVKLFNKDGRHLANIGDVGRGPGEYFALNDQQIDEENQRIYLIPWHTDKILDYDLNGKFLKSIPSPIYSMKAIFRVHPNQTITMIRLPVDASQPVIWTQDSMGRIISEKSLSYLNMQRSFNDEIYTNKTTSHLDFHITTWGRELKDTLYHYDARKNVVLKKFTMNFQQEPSIHIYGEFPGYYFASIADVVGVLGGEVGRNYRHLIIDKTTCKGAFVKIKNDLLGGIPVAAPEWLGYKYRDEHYAECIDPVTLKESLEEALRTNHNMSQDVRKRIENLINSISKDDNDYIIYGKLR